MVRGTFWHDPCFTSPTMFRATVETGVDGSVIRVAGRLTAEFVRDLERLCLSTEPPLVIDASELRSCDAEGLAFIAQALDGSATVAGLSEYLFLRVRLERSRGSSETH